MILDHPGITPNVGVHERFISKLTNCPSKMIGIEQQIAQKIKFLGVTLGMAKSARFKADYKLLCDVEKVEAEAQLELAEKIFDKINEITILLSSDKIAKVKSI